MLFPAPQAARVSLLPVRRFIAGLTRRSPHPSRLGDAALVVFLLVQLFDGALTYLGVVTLGREMEGNPLLLWLIGSVGEGPAIAGAKVMAGSFGIALHVVAVHRAVVALTLFYLTTAIIPWIAILFW